MRLSRRLCRLNKLSLNTPTPAFPKIVFTPVYKNTLLTPLKTSVHMSLSAMSSEFVPGAAEFVLETCPICLDTIDNTNRKVFVPCSHVFHDSCAQTFRKYVDASHAVPCLVCRTPVDNLPALESDEAARILTETFPDFVFKCQVHPPSSFLIWSRKLVIEWNITITNRWTVRKEVRCNDGTPSTIILWHCATMDHLIELLRRDLPTLKRLMQRALA